MSHPFWRWLAANALILFLLPGRATAAGLYLLPPGVHALSLGGALASDAGQVGASALFYNVAGLGGMPSSLQFDMLSTWQWASFQPAQQRQMPLQKGEGLKIPIPLLGFSWQLSKHISWGYLLSSEVPNLIQWEQTSSDIIDSPHRYAIRSNGLNVLAKNYVGVGAIINPQLSIGAGLQLLAGTLSMSSTFSACDGFFCVQPEDPAYDVGTSLQAPWLWSTAMQIGAIWRPYPWLRLGANWQSNFYINTPVKLVLQLPQVGPFVHATINPAHPSGRLMFNLPGALRLGVQWIAHRRFSSEIDVTYTPWHIHQNIRVTPHRITVDNLAGIAQMTVQPINWERGFRDNVAIAWGNDYAHSIMGHVWHFRAGALVEPDTIPERLLAPGLVDLAKLVLSAGVGIQFGQATLDVVAATVRMWPRRVRQSSITVPNVVYPISPDLTPALGEGYYQGSAAFLGIGLKIAL